MTLTSLSFAIGGGLTFSQRTMISSAVSVVRLGLAASEANRQQSLLNVRLRLSSVQPPWNL